MKFQKEFPEWYRAFTHGEISLLMERTGGVHELALVDCLVRDGVVYPDNALLRVFSRIGGSSGNRPLMGGAFRFLEITDRDEVDYVAPDAPEVFPWGFRSKYFTMFLDDHRVFSVIKKEKASDKFLRLVVNPEYQFRQETMSIKNQRCSEVGKGNSAIVGRPIRLDYPQINGKLTRTIHEAQRIGKCLVYHITLHFPYGDKELYLAFYGGEDVVFTEDPIMDFMDFPWGAERQRTVILATGETAEEACQKAVNSVAGADALLRAKLKQDAANEKNAANVQVDGWDEISAFFKEQSRYLHALLVADKNGIRAASHKFSLFAMWDAIFPIRDFLRNGEFEQAKKMYRYLIHYPNMEFFFWGSMHLTIMLDEILAYGDDPELVQEAYPILKQFMDSVIKVADPKLGFFGDLCNCGVDYISELGLSGRHYAACHNGFFYSALRTIENLASDLGDSPAKYRTARETLQKNYLPYFFDEKEGYLRMALDLDGTPAPVEVMINTSTIALEFPFGERLFGDKLNAIAHFKASKMKHPLGYSAVPHNSPLPCEMWRNVHMNQHLGHEGKLARLSNNVPEVKRVMKAYFDKFAEYGVAVETYNLAGTDGNASQVANWQSFSATASTTAIISGLAGIFHHRGGYSYEPADAKDKITMTQFRINGKLLNIVIRGKGKYAVSKFNGKTLNGTLQLPADLPLKKQNVWEIIRTDKMPETPVLISTHGLPVKDLKSGGGYLAFTACRSGAYPVKLLNDAVLRTFINHKEVETDCFHEITVNAGDLVEFKK